MTTRFPALRTRQTDGGVPSQIEQLTVDDLSAGEVVVKPSFFVTFTVAYLLVLIREKVLKKSLDLTND